MRPRPAGRARRRPSPSTRRGEVERADQTVLGGAQRQLDEAPPAEQLAARPRARVVLAPTPSDGLRRSGTPRRPATSRAAAPARARRSTSPSRSGRGRAHRRCGIDCAREQRLVSASWPTMAVNGKTAAFIAPPPSSLGFEVQRHAASRACSASALLPQPALGRLEQALGRSPAAPTGSSRRRSRPGSSGSTTYCVGQRLVHPVLDDARWWRRSRRGSRRWPPARRRPCSRGGASAAIHLGLTTRLRKTRPRSSASERACTRSGSAESPKHGLGVAAGERAHRGHHAAVVLEVVVGVEDVVLAVVLVLDRDVDAPRSARASRRAPGTPSGRGRRRSRPTPGRPRRGRRRRARCRSRAARIGPTRTPPGLAPKMRGSRAARRVLAELGHEAVAIGERVRAHVVALDRLVEAGDERARRRRAARPGAGRRRGRSREIRTATSMRGRPELGQRERARRRPRGASRGSTPAARRAGRGPRPTSSPCVRIAAVPHTRAPPSRGGRRLGEVAAHQRVGERGADVCHARALGSALGSTE